MNGEAKPGRLLAIMGPSGSGKTTLLNVLAGQTVSSPRIHLSGLLEVNGRPMANKAYKYVLSKHCIYPYSFCLLVITVSSKFFLTVFGYWRVCLSSADLLL